MLECQALKDQHSVVRSVRERQCSKKVGYCDAVWLTTFVGIAEGSIGGSSKLHPALCLDEWIVVVWWHGS